MKLLLLALVVATVSVLVAWFLCPTLSIIALTLGLWVAFEHCGLAHWFVGQHPEAVRIHYNLLWTQSY